MFNWWADLLRLKSRMRGGNQIQAGQLYNHWVKEQVVQNVPFDQMTYSLVTAEGIPVGKRSRWLLPTGHRYAP